MRWSNAVMQRIAGTQIRAGRPLVHSVRDPELLACVEAALEQREVALRPRQFAGSRAHLRDQCRSLAHRRRAGRSPRRHPHRGRGKIAPRFIANVSHELRTPLTSIQGYVETLMEEPAPRPETTREFLGVILKNATRMNRITEDLLALASVESPDYKLALQPARASALVQDAIESLGGMVVDSGVELESTGAPERWSWPIPTP